MKILGIGKQNALVGQQDLEGSLFPGKLGSQAADFPARKRAQAKVQINTFNFNSL